MRTLLFHLFLLVAMVILSAHSASIPKVPIEDSVESLRNLVVSHAGRSGASGTPEKRYATQHLADLKGKKYEAEALMKLLQHIYMGKRSSKLSALSPSEGVGMGIPLDPQQASLAKGIGLYEVDTNGDIIFRLSGAISV